MIIGSIKKGIKRLVEIPLRRQDGQDLEQWRANLAARLASAQGEARDNIRKGLTEIDRILN